MEVNKVQEWSIINISPILRHPMHINHFQVKVVCRMISWLKFMFHCSKAHFIWFGIQLYWLLFYHHKKSLKIANALGALQVDNTALHFINYVSKQELNILNLTWHSNSKHKSIEETQTSQNLQDKTMYTNMISIQDHQRQ